MSPQSSTLRWSLVVVILVSTVTLALGYVDAQRRADRVVGSPAVEQALRTGDRSPVAPARDAITVVATDSNAFVSEERDSPRAQAELVAFAPDGSIYYHENDHTRYWDVDQVPGTSATVEFVYADHLDPARCDGGGPCTRNGIERVNLTTGERTAVYSRLTPGKHATRWHDADRIDATTYLVADIDRDSAFVVDTETGLVEWSWDAQSDYDVTSGGPYPDDWTHLNDVEAVTVDGRPAVMVSLRNHDQVAFVGRERGHLANWTLGSDGDHDRLYEQHNPDYIPPDRGGPAVVVADSENGRIVEYQRRGGEWHRSWTWTDQRLQWPRDADRLPNGHTLVTDSNGDRVLELDENGRVVWSVSIGFPYEAERLGTGDESEGGASAASLSLPSHSTAPAQRTAVDHLTARLPPSVANAIAYVFPRWIGLVEGVAALSLLGSLLWLLGGEITRRDVSISVRSPLRFRRNEE